MANKERPRKSRQPNRSAGTRRSGAKAGTREPLQSLAEQHGVELDAFEELVRTTVSARLDAAKLRAKLLRYQRAAEECMRAYAAINGDEEGGLFIGRILGVAEPRLPSLKRPWLLAALDTFDGSDAGDDERRETVERRILLEYGATPNEIAAFQNRDDTSVRRYVSSAEARAGRREAARLRQKLSTEISALKQSRESLADGNGNVDQPLGRRILAFNLLPHLDTQIAERETILAVLDARRRRGGGR